MSTPGILFFPILVNENGFEPIENRFGIKGFGVFIRILQNLYRSDGYYLKYDKDIKLSLARQCQVDCNLVSDIIEMCVSKEIFDKSLFQRFRILTSAKIQENYLKAVKRRTTEVILKKEYLILSDPKVAELVKNVNKKVQRKEDKTKEENSSKEESETPSCDVSLLIERFTREFPNKGLGGEINGLPKDFNLEEFLQKIRESDFLQKANNFTLRYMLTKAYAKIMTNYYANATGNLVLTTNKPARNYEQRTYTKEEVNKFYDNIEDVEI